MDYLQQLLNNQPVEWKKLGEVCTKVCSGGTPSTSNPEYYKGNIPWLRTQDVDWKDVYDTDIKITEEAIKNSSAQWIPANCVIVAMYGATAAKACINRIPLTTNQACCNLQVDENIAHYKYVYHWICREYERLRALGEGSQSNLSGKKIKDYKIPIPPLSVQSRIVEILDKFTAMEAELQAELELRKKQYAYYREQLLNFSYTPPSEFNVVYRKLGEMAELVRGNGLSKKDFAPEGIPAIHYGQIYTYYGNETKETISFVTPETASKLRKVFCGNVVITNTSENLEDVGKALLYTGKSEAVTGGHATIIRCSEHLLPKFFVYYTKTRSFFDQKRKLAKGTKVIDVSATDLARIEIPIPPLSEQQRIVEILDKFDTLTNSISEGLPLEIKLRRQQYEYYREQLLDFRN
jgi:type I restriction/modification specificity protein